MEVSFFIPSKRLVNSSQQISLVLAHHQSHVQIKRIHHPVAHLLIHSYLIIHDVQQNSITFINVTKKAKKKKVLQSQSIMKYQILITAIMLHHLKVKEKSRGVYVYKARTFFFSCYYELFQLSLLHVERTLVALLFVNTSSLLDIA
jgi:hypothetical protein